LSKPPEEKKEEIKPEERYAVSKSIYTLGLLPIEYVRMVIDQIESVWWLEGYIQGVWIVLTPKIPLQISPLEKGE
jgi:hypothetical protein